MKKILLAVALLLALCCGANAQVSVEVRLDQEQFLPGETLQAAVRIVNRSGQTLHLGEDEDWLLFSIESKDGYIVAKNGETPVVEPFILESSKAATKDVDLSPYFALNNPGHYKIIATVKFKNWDTQLSSPPKEFDIIKGSRLWEQTFGLPNTDTNSSNAPEARKYILQQANYLRSQLRLYLRVTDVSETHAIRVIPIGTMISLSRPEPQLDQQSNIHVLYQNGPHSFSYTVFDPGGEQLVRQTFDYGTVRPRLKMDATGKIFVAGGARHLMLDDYPTPVSDDGLKFPTLKPPQEPPVPAKTAP